MYSIVYKPWYFAFQIYTFYRVLYSAKQPLKMKPYSWIWEKKQSLFFEKSLTWGHRKSTRNIMFENKKIKYFLKFVTFWHFLQRIFIVFHQRESQIAKKNRGPEKFYRWWDLFFYFHTQYFLSIFGVPQIVIFQKCHHFFFQKKTWIHFEKSLSEGPQNSIGNIM